MSQYDLFNRLSEAKTDKGKAVYGYKPDGMRLSKTLSGDYADSPNVSKSVLHIWDGENIVLELGAETPGTEKVRAVYIRGNGLIKNQEGNYYIFNAHGDVVQLVGNDGEIKRRYSYDAFGVERNAQKDDDNPFRYCGE